MSQQLSPSSFFLRRHHHHPPGTKALAAPSPRPWPHQTGLCPSLPRSLCGPRTSQWAAQAAHGNCWKVQGRRERGCLGPRGRRERPSSGVLLSTLPLPAVGTCRACLPRPAWWPPGAAARSESHQELAAMPLKPRPSPRSPLQAWLPFREPQPHVLWGAGVPAALTCTAPCRPPPAPGGTGGHRLPAAA